MLYQNQLHSRGWYGYPPKKICTAFCLHIKRDFNPSENYFLIILVLRFLKLNRKCAGKKIWTGKKSKSEDLTQREILCVPSKRERGHIPTWDVGNGEGMILGYVVRLVDVGDETSQGVRWGGQVIKEDEDGPKAQGVLEVRRGEVEGVK